MCFVSGNTGTTSVTIIAGGAAQMESSIIVVVWRAHKHWKCHGSPFAYLDVSTWQTSANSFFSNSTTVLYFQLFFLISVCCLMPDAVCYDYCLPATTHPTYNILCLHCSPHCVAVCPCMMSWLLTEPAVCAAPTDYALVGSGITGNVLQSRALMLVDCRPVRLFLGSLDGLSTEESDLINVLGVQAVPKPRKSNPINTHVQFENICICPLNVLWCVTHSVSLALCLLW